MLHGHQSDNLPFKEDGMTRRSMPSSFHVNLFALMPVRCSSSTCEAVMAETGADFGLHPFLCGPRSWALCSQKIYEQVFGTYLSTCTFSVEKLCYSKNSIASRLFLLNGRYLINY